MARLPVLVAHGAGAWIVVAAAIAIGVAIGRRRRGAARAVLAGGLAGAIAVAGLAGLGQLALCGTRVTGHAGPRIGYDLGELDPLVLAAGLPGSRDGALDEIAGRLAAYYVRTEATLTRWQQIARIRGGCAGELAMLRDQERIAELARRAASCDDDAAAARALLVLGDYAGAARRAERTAEPAIDALIGARAWAAAARAAAAFRDRLLRGENRSLFVQLQPDAPVKIAPRLTCAELYFRIRAGEAAAAARLGAAVGDDPFCKVIEALARPLDAQGAALAAAYAAAPDAQAHQTIEALAWAAGAPLIDDAAGGTRALRSGALVQLEPSRDDEVQPAILAPFARAVRHDPDGSRAGELTRLWYAAYLRLRGDPRATAEALAVWRASSDQDLGVGDDARSFAAALALSAGAPLPDEIDPGHRLSLSIAELARLARGDAEFLHGQLSFENRDCLAAEGRDGDAALVAAVGGDGAPLADAIDRCAIRVGRSIAPVFGAWPRIRRDRDRLRAQLAVAPPDVPADAPLGVIRRALIRRDVARLTGDAAGAAAWQGVLDRHLDALADREVAIALVMWHLL